MRREREDSTTPLRAVDMVPADAFEAALLEVDGKRHGRALLRGATVPLAPAIHEHDFDLADRDTQRLPKKQLAHAGVEAEAARMRAARAAVAAEATAILRIGRHPWWRRAAGETLLVLGNAAAWLAEVLLRTGTSLRSPAIIG